MAARCNSPSKEIQIDASIDFGSSSSNNTHLGLPDKLSAAVEPSGIDTCSNSSLLDLPDKLPALVESSKIDTGSSSSSLLDLPDKLLPAVESSGMDTAEELVEEAVTQPAEKRPPTKQTLFDALFESAPSSRFSAAAKRLNPASSRGSTPDRHQPVARIPSAAASTSSLPSLGAAGFTSQHPPVGFSEGGQSQLAPAGISQPRPLMPLSVNIESAQRVNLQPMFSPDADERLGKDFC